MKNAWELASSRVLKYWGVLAFIVGTLLAIAALPGTYVDPKLPSWIYKSALWIAVSICALLTVAWVLRTVSRNMTRDIIEKFVPASRDEIQDVLPFYDRVIGGGGTQRASINALKAMFNANRTIFRLYKRESRKGSKRVSEVTGFCTVIPMNQAGADLLAAGDLNGLKMDAKHIASVRGRCFAIYIGSIGAEGSRAKGEVLSYVLGVMDEYENKGVGRAYTRPVTADGLRVAKRYGFMPLSSAANADELGELYFKDFAHCAKRRNRSTAVKLSSPIAAKAL